MRALRPVHHRSIAGLVRQLARQLVRDPEPQIRVERAEQPDGGGVAGHAVHQPRAPLLLGQPVAVGDEAAASGDVDLGLARVERDAQVFREEIAAPAIVVPTHERDGDPAGAQALELRHGPEVTPRDHRPVLEP